MVSCSTLHSSSLILTKHLRPPEYGFVEFSRQKVRIYPTSTQPRFRIFLIWYSGRNGPTSDVLINLSVTEVNAQVVLETYSTRPFLGYSAFFFYRDGPTCDLTNCLQTLSSSMLVPGGT